MTYNLTGSNDNDEVEDLQREREITVRALKAELIVTEEMLRDPTQPPEHKDDTYLDLRALSNMLTRMGECSAITSNNPEQPNDPTAATINTPIRYCTKKYHEEGDHEWL